jgi:DNA-binding NarL/FixJ family response regulator
MNAKKSIILVDDHQLMTSGLSVILNQYTDFEILACLSNGKELLQKLKFNKPDLVVMDINMPQLDGIETSKLVKTQYPAVKIVVVSMYNDENIFNSIIKLGVDGFIPKQTDSLEFVRIIKEIMEGEKIFIKPISKHQNKEYQQAETSGKLQLSVREIEILKLIKEGFSSKEISEKLYLSILTVNTHRKNICKKLNISSPLALIKYIHQIDL